MCSIEQLHLELFFKNTSYNLIDWNCSIGFIDYWAFIFHYKDHNIYSMDQNSSFLAFTPSIMPQLFKYRFYVHYLFCT